MRALAASFDAIVMVALAFSLGGVFATPLEVAVLWGGAAAAVVAAVVVLAGAATLGWLAVGYIVGSALLTEPPFPPSLLVALAYLPLLPRPRRSLGTGIALAAVSAVLFRFALARLL